MINEFSFDGVHSSKFKITCDRETHFLLPMLKTYTDEIAGCDGVIDYGIGGYDARQISTDIYFEGSLSELREMKNEIIAWLASANGEYKKLIFDDESDCYYMAKIVQATDLTITPNSNKIGTLVFMCNPPWQYRNGILQTPETLKWDNADSVESNQLMKTFTTSGDFKFTNTGMATVKPIIYVYGKTKTTTDGSRLKLTANGKNILINGAFANDCIVIDCQNETITLRSLGRSIIDSVLMSGFFEFAPGKCTLSVSSSSGISAWPNDVDIIIEFNPTA